MLANIDGKDSGGGALETRLSVYDLFGDSLGIKYRFPPRLDQSAFFLTDTMDNSNWTFLQTFTPEFQAMRSGLHST